MTTPSDSGLIKQRSNAWFVGVAMLVIAVAIAATSALVAFAAPAGAEPRDQQFFSTLDRLGFVTTDASLLISQGHMICDEGLAHGVSWGEMHGQLLEWGYTHDAASVLAIAAIDSYCPQYRSLAAQIAEGVFSSAPGTQSPGPLPISDATSPKVRPFFEALDAAQILQLGSVYSPDILGAANRACTERASGRDLNSINTSVGQDLRALGLDWVTDDVSGGIVSIAFTQLCPR